MSTRDMIHGHDNGDNGAGSKPLLQSSQDAARHRILRGEEEHRVYGATGVGVHYDIGGLKDFGPVDTERESRCSLDRQSTDST